MSTLEKERIRLAKWRAENPDKVKAYHQKWRGELVSYMLSRSRRRATRKGLAFELTGPFMPSIDRLDSNAGYVKDNCRVVALIYNMAKSSWSDDIVYTMAKALVTKEEANDKLP